MELGTVRGVFTVLVIIAFIAVVLWAYSSRRQRAFEEAAQLPLEEDSPATGGPRKEKPTKDNRIREGKPAAADGPEARQS